MTHRGGRKIGGMDRGICSVCGEDVAIRRNGRPIRHGPLNNPCSGSLATAGQVAQTVWDASAGRPRGWASVDERVRNGAQVANTAAGNWSNTGLWGDRTQRWRLAENAVAIDMF